MLVKQPNLFPHVWGRYPFVTVQTKRACRPERSEGSHLFLIYCVLHGRQSTDSLIK